VRFCLAEAGLSLADIDHVAINRNPKANLFRPFCPLDNARARG